MKTWIHGLVAAAWLAGALPGRADDATNRVTSPRDYTNRVQFHQVDLDVNKPGEAENAGVTFESDRTRPGTLGLDADRPILYVPVTRPVPVKKKKKDWTSYSGKDTSANKKESGWGWLADEVSKVEQRDKKAAGNDGSGDREESDAESEEEQTADQGDAREGGRVKTLAVDGLTPSLYREYRAGSQAVVRADVAGSPLERGSRDPGPSVPASWTPDRTGIGSMGDALSAGAPAKLSQDATDVFGFAGHESSAASDRALKIDSGFSPLLSSPTPLPGESSGFQTISPSLGGVGGDSSAGSSFSVGWSSSFGADTPARADSSEGLLKIGSDTSHGFGENPESMRTTTLPW
ncbi:MAG: hypothetical protein V1929_02955 [bacterium]